MPKIRHIKIRVGEKVENERIVNSATVQGSRILWQRTKIPACRAKRHFHRIWEHMLAGLKTKTGVSGSEDICKDHKLEGFIRKEEEWKLEVP